MRIVVFCHSLISDWNHGNAHFLRGIASELLSRGHVVEIYEPCDAWSVRSLTALHGEKPLRDFAHAYPMLRSHRYDRTTLDLERALDAADLVLVHEWNDHELVQRIGDHRRANASYRLLFHDTHHRSVTDSGSVSAYRLEHYDGVLAYGRVIRDIYLERGWTARAWTWHEAADVRVFRPLSDEPRRGDLVWVGNWGDDERTAELHEYLLKPVRALRLRAKVHGVRYPDDAVKRLRDAGIEYAGWLPNYDVPRVFARHAVTIHIPRRPYAAALPGIPTIRPFEALACGIPLICAPWNDDERLFIPGADFLVARDGDAMRRQLRAVLNDQALAADLTAHGRATILASHTCAHRVDELLAIYASLESSLHKDAAAA